MDSENYLNKLSRARRNYSVNWAYVPYFYSRIYNWYNLSDNFKFLFNNNNLGDLRFLLKNSVSYWSSKDLCFFSPNVNNATPTYSLLSTPGRSS